MSALDDVRARVREAGGVELLERLEALEEARRFRAKHPPKPGTRALGTPRIVDVDVVLAGGGLWLLLAPLLSSLGLRVAVLDRGAIGRAHREWNASGPELQALVAVGLLAPEELSSLIVARYDYGVCRWHGGGSYPVRGVLDHAVDAGRLLALARDRALARGAQLFEGHEVQHHLETPTGVRVLAAAPQGDSVEFRARLLVDARGASSPWASADLLCPTVGGVLEGLDEGEGPLQMNPRVGDILATTEGVEEGRQHIWEAFPGAEGQTTVYLFHYARAESVEPGELLRLYARFFRTLPRYKSGNARLLRPTFGYIPGWSRLTPAPRAPGRRVLLVGDAAARHSPLTFCGFGSMLRRLGPTASAIAKGLGSDDLPTAFAALEADPFVHTGTGALAHLVASPSHSPGRAGELNDLLDTAFRTLHELGEGDYGALLRDEMDAGGFIRFLRRVAAQRPRVYADVFRILPPSSVLRWSSGLARGWARELAPGRGSS